MTLTNLEITHAGPQVSIQDQGRFGLLRFGVPASGPMDRLAFAVANLALGNPAGQAAIEVSLGGLTLRCADHPVSFAVAGGDFQVTVDQTPQAAWCVAGLQPGETLSIRPGRWGSWCYLAFAGAVHCTPWLGSASTHGPSGLGGGRLASSGVLRLEHAVLRPERHRRLICPVSALPRRSVRVVLGPQNRFFDDETITTFLTSPFTLTDAYDRMGVRLSGPSLQPSAKLDMPSEAISRGAVQVAGDGVATVLLADHQTTGGYPKIATLLSTDSDRFAQCRSRDQVSFEAITADAAISANRTRSMASLTYLSSIARMA